MTIEPPEVLPASIEQSQTLPESRDWSRLEQIRRARRLLTHAEAETADRDLCFVLLLGALHLSRAVVEHWYALADVIPGRLNKADKDADMLAKRLRQEFENVFSKGRRYSLITELRGWDYHWGPLRTQKWSHQTSRADRWRQWYFRRDQRRKVRLFSMDIPWRFAQREVVGVSGGQITIGFSSHGIAISTPQKLFRCA